MIPLTPNERSVIRSRFAMSLANLQVIKVFFSPSHRKICARSHPQWTEEQAFSSGQGRRPLPNDVVFVGVYSSPFPSPVFVEDLNELVARLD